MGSKPFFEAENKSKNLAKILLSTFRARSPFYFKLDEIYGLARNFWQLGINSL
jgi:hypothetical protein